MCKQTTPPFLAGAVFWLSVAFAMQPAHAFDNAAVPAPAMAAPAAAQVPAQAAAPLIPPDVAAAALPPVVVPANTYFPLFPFEAADDALPQLLPVASNHALSGAHPGLTRAIITLHDVSRDANAAVAVLSALAGSADSTTIILSPQFLIDADIARAADHLPNHGKIFVRWPYEGWEDGGDSIATPPQKGISSFTALDMLLLFLGERNFFPDLTQIVVVGHGGGGDFVQRYAAVGRAPDILAQENIPLRFVVGDASSYLYFTAPRPKGGQQGFGLPDITACPDYNAYRYGLDKLNAYATRVGAEAIRMRYVTRTITYLTGEKAPMNDPSPDVSCAAKLQGSDRVARAVNYGVYLDSSFGESSHKQQTFVTVPKVGYDAVGLFGSSCGMAALFGDGTCG